MANKMRLIDANTAMLNTYNEVWWTESEAAAVCSFLVQQKTVDAVEVVRCKDCKHHEHYDTLLYCGHTRGLAGSVSPGYFCIYGEREEDHVE